MNEQIERCLYQAGLTAQGCWDELDDYARQGIEEFAYLLIKQCIFEIVHECVLNHSTNHSTNKSVQNFMVLATKRIQEKFGIEQ